MSDLAGQAALVAGGSRGVGRAIALEFARRGARVAVLYRASRDLADDVVRQISDSGGEALSIQADLKDVAAAADAVAKTVTSFGALDILCMSAGADVEWKPVRDHNATAWADFITNDLVGAFNIFQPAIVQMHEQRNGVIIAISSIAAQMCQSRNSQGAAAKAGVEALVRVVAREEGRYGIRANAISIGLTDTDQTQRAFDQWGEEATQKIVAGIPLGRIAKPEEIAAMAAYLAGNAGSYITGKVIQVDGGQIISG